MEAAFLGREHHGEETNCAYALRRQNTVPVHSKPKEIDRLTKSVRLGQCKERDI